MEEFREDLFIDEVSPVSPLPELDTAPEAIEEVVPVNVNRNGPHYQLEIFDGKQEELDRPETKKDFKPLDDIKFDFGVYERRLSDDPHLEESVTRSEDDRARFLPDLHALDLPTDDSREESEETCPDAQEDVSPEEVVEYVNEDGIRVRKIIRKTVTMKTVTLTQGKEISVEADKEPIESTVVLTQRDDVEPVPVEGEVQTYVNEQGRVVSRVIHHVTTRTTTIRRTVNGKVLGPDEPANIVLESGEPVYLGEEPTEEATKMEEQPREIVLPTTRERKVDLPDWLVPFEAKPKNQKEFREEFKKEPPADAEGANEVSRPLLDSLRRPYVEEEALPSSEDGSHARRFVTTKSLSTKKLLTVVEPDGGSIEEEVPQGADETPGEVEECVDEDGRLARRLTTTKTVITKRIERGAEEGIVDTVPTVGEVRQEEEEMDYTTPDVVEEFVDKDGTRVKRFITTQTVITKRTVSRRVGGVLVESVFPPEGEEIENTPEDVEEYVDEEGKRVKRFISVRSAIIPGQVSKKSHRYELSEAGFESATPVYFRQEAPERPTLESTHFEEILFKKRDIVLPSRAPTLYEIQHGQHYITIIQTLYQLVMERRSVITIYCERFKQFNFVFEHFLQWMLDVERKLSCLRPVTWHLEDIRRQQQLIKVSSVSD